MKALFPSILAVLALLATACADAATLLLAQDGEAKAVIVVPATASEEEKLAANELATYLRKVSGATFTILPEGDEDLSQPSLLVGSTLAGRAQLADLGLGYDGFLINVEGHRVVLAGATGTGTLTAVYAFLERLGCRWYMPGEIGEVIPRKPTVEVQPFQSMETPSFLHRLLWKNGHIGPPMKAENRQAYSVWCRRNRLGGLPAMIAHNLTSIIPAGDYFQSHQEYFGLGPDETGKLVRDPKVICGSNPEVIEIAAQKAIRFFEENPLYLSYSLSAFDGGGSLECYCPQCTEIERPHEDGTGRVALYVNFANEVAEKVAARFPDKFLAYLAKYSTLGSPKGLTVHPNTLPMMVDIHCAAHSMLDYDCPSKAEMHRVVQDWSEASRQIGVYDYQLYPPVPLPLSMAEEIPYWHKAGAILYSGELMGHDEFSNIVLYVMARLLWGADQNIEAILDEFFRNYYGEAARPMRAYFDLIQERIRSLEGLAFGSLGTASRILTPRVLSEAQRLLDDASEKAHSAGVRERVRLMHLSFLATEQSVEAFRAYYRYLSTGLPTDRAAARKATAKLNDALSEIEDLDLVAADFLKRHAQGWLERLNTRYEPPGVSSEEEPKDHYTQSEQFSQEYELVTYLPSLWRFNLDLLDDGLQRGWREPELDDSSWLSLSVLDIWERQGFAGPGGATWAAGYDGIAWYRTTFQVPPEFAGRRLILHFGAVDETCQIYINGQLAFELINSLPTDWFSPFEFDATLFLHAGINHIAVKVVDDIGAGGIWKPVLLYSPRQT